MASNNTTTNAASKQPAADPKAPSAGQGRGQEQSFHILPHPAQSNNPADLQQPSEETGGLQTSQGAFSAFQSPGPVKLNPDNLKNLPPAKTKEELAALQAELNK